MQKRGRILLPASAGLLWVVLAAADSFAAESGKSFYLLGSRGPLAGITPPPGIFFQNDLYYYSGGVGRTVELPFGREIVAGVDGQALIELPTTIWVTPAEIFGGHLAFTATVPVVGHQDVHAFLGSRSVSDSLATIGDPVVGSFIGWNAGNFHWQTGVNVNVPVGDYRDGGLANIAFNHWAADVYAALTWLDPAIGLDLSGAVGVTFNGENPATDYRTGNEFHVEFAAVQHFNEQFSAGVVGYYYDQISGDSGAGAVLGPFEGRVTALGVTIGYDFKLGALPVSTRIKYFHEFDTKNRLQGDAVYLSASFPLWVPQ